MKTTKRAMLSSVIALFLCFTMLMGTTYAWFTDEVTSENNVIKSGNLDVVLEYYNGTEWKDVQGASDILTNKLWEPGTTEVAYLRFKNNGSLALKYQLGVNIDEAAGVNAAGAQFKLSDYIYYDVFDAADANGNFAPFANRDAAMKNTTEETLISAGYNKAGTLAAGTEAAPAPYTYLAMVVYMPTTVGNVANHNGVNVPQINLGINIFATQVAAEKDSFGDDYDEDAWHTEMKVYTADDLNDALANAIPGTEIVLQNDIELTSSLVIPAAAATTYSLRSNNAVKLDLNGKKITAAMEKSVGALIVNNGNLVIEGNEATLIENTAVNGSALIVNNGVLTLNGGNYKGAPSDTATGTASYAINTAGAGALTTVNGANISGRGAIGVTNGAKAVLNGGTYHTPAVAWGHAVYAVDEGTEVVINGGTFSEGYEMTANNWGMYQIYSGKKAKVTVNGGTFMPWDCANGYDLYTATEGTITVRGGTFAENPSSQNKINYVADGFKAVENGGKYYVVPEEVGTVIVTADDLLALGGKSLEGVVYIAADIDLNGAAMPTIGAAYGKSLTVIGAGHTISNATTARTTHNGMEHHGFFYAYTNSILTVSDLSFDGIVIDATKDAGRNYGAAILVAYADGGSNVVLNNVDTANCKVLNNTPDIGDEAGVYVGYQTGTLTMTDCDSVKCEVAGETAEKTGSFIGMVNGTATLTNCTTDLEIGYCNRIGGTLVVDGMTVVTNADALESAVAKGVTNLLLADGVYNVNNCGGKKLTINGSKDVVIKLYNEGEDGCDYGFGSSTGVGHVTFNGITIDTTENTGNYKGFAYMKGIFNDCNFVGAYSLNNANDFVFNRCTFDFKNGYFWTWGANSVTFDGCTFNGNSKTILAHGSASTVININNCTFAATEKGYTGAGDNTAVVEMDPISSNTYTVNFTGENTITDSYAGWTRVKDDSKGHVINGLN